jgi:type VI secretion system protein ImpL
MLVYLITGVVLLLYLVLAWFLGSWFHLQSPDIWILRGGLALIGIAAAAVVLWFYTKSRKAKQAEGQGAGQQGLEEIDLLVHEALGALRKSTLGRGATLRNQPLIFFIGDAGSAKTNVIIHSGLDPELLAGQVYQDNNVLPTRVANMWYTQSAILVDAAGGLLQQPARWKRLVQLVRPGRASSALSTSQQAPRAAVICFDTASFLQPGAGEATLAAARKLSTRLHDITHMLGISLPVYVLFTKLDRLQGFTEFARMLGPDEAAQVLGATMPIRSVSSGVYADDETKRLTAVFEEIFFSLADKRLDLLARENDTDSLPSIYEFPRELRKLRTLLVQFLVELGRPSRLSVNPFLRGFYFSGVRPVFVEDGVSAAPQASVPDSRLNGGATQVFSSPIAHLAAAAPVRSSGRRKVPQWTFLARLFNEVIVKDRVALAASGVSSKVNFIRRIAWISAATLSLVAIIGFLVSFLGNRQLEKNVQAAAAEVQHLGTNPHQLPSLSDLQKLDRLREEIKTLAAYNKEGVPLRLRWFLYVGDAIRPDARKVYFSAFKQLLFDNAQSVILGDLHRLPDQPGPNDSFDATYYELKAHLITSQHPEKSTNDFPASILTEKWKAANNIVDDRADLAKRQFEYYSAELNSGDPIGTKPDDAAIGRARNYLAKFAGIDRYYRPLIDKASSGGDANFYARFADARGMIVNTPSVKGAFTPAGFQAFSTAIRDLSRSVAGEDWVLGQQTSKDLNQGAMQQQLMQRYQQDFIKEWRGVLESSHVSKYEINDADQKLDRLASTSSPLLELLWFVATFTNVEKVSEPFASVDNVEPPGSPDRRPDQLLQPSNQPYIQALGNLQTTLKALSQNGTTDQIASSAVLKAAGDAHLAAKLAVGSKVDNQYQHTEQLTQRLLEEPIINAELIVGGESVRQLNGAGQSLCAQFGQMAQVFPFKSSSADELTADQFNGFFAPKTGALWSSYDKVLSKSIVKEGSRYKEAAGSPNKINPHFLDFFNHMALITEAFYPNNAPSPNLAYSLAIQDTNVDKLILTIGGAAVSQIGQAKTFNWIGSPQDVKVTAEDKTYFDQSGTWAIARFIQSGTGVNHSYTDLRWNLRINDNPVQVKGKQAFYAFKLQTGSPNPFELVLSPGARCDPRVVLAGPK